jgi:hypothetical protein
MCFDHLCVLCIIITSGAMRILFSGYVLCILFSCSGVYS